MRPHAFVSVVLLLCACTSAHDESTASPSPLGSPQALRSCEARELTLDGVDLLVQANVDGTPGSVIVQHAPDDAAAQHALADVRTMFGEAHHDDRVQTRALKDGLVKITDMCGNFATYPPATPSAAPSPSQK